MKSNSLGGSESVLRPIPVSGLGEGEPIEKKVELVQPNAPVGFGAKTSNDVAYQPIEAAAELSLLPAPVTESAAEMVRQGYGYQRRLDMLVAAKDQDPEVARIFLAIKARLGADADALTEALADRGSPTREVFGAYLEWVAHRGAKEAPESEANQAERHELDPAMVRTRTAAVVDLVVERLLQLGVPIPDEPAKALLSLFRGGVDRIQARADSWMINHKVSELYETERALLSERPIAAEDLWKGILVLHDLDGGSPLGFQPERRPKPESDSVKETGSLVASKTNTDVTVVERKNSLMNVTRQSSAAARALATIEAKLGELNPRSPEYARALDLYCSYSSALLYDSRKVWANFGVVDRLAELAVTHGQGAHQKAVLDLMYGGLEKIRFACHTDFDRGLTSYRTIYVDLANLILARERWDQPTLDFVFEKLAWLQTFSRANELPKAEARMAEDEIRKVRRNEAADASGLLAVLAGPPSEPARVRFGAFTMKLALRDTTADGVPVKTLEIRDLRSTLKEDGETFETLRRLEQHALDAGLGAVQLADWQNYHEAKVFRDRPEYREILRPKILGQGRAVEEPTFIKTLQPALEQPWDTSTLTKFLGSDASRALLRLGNFQISFRRPVVAPIPAKRCLTLTLVDADVPGSGKFTQALRTIEAEARRHGFDAFVIEGVGDPNQRRFYEEKMGYQIVPGAAPEYRSYFTKL